MAASIRAVKLSCACGASECEQVWTCLHGSELAQDHRAADATDVCQTPYWQSLVAYWEAMDLCGSPSEGGGVLFKMKLAR